MMIMVTVENNDNQTVERSDAHKEPERNPAAPDGSSGTTEPSIAPPSAAYLALHDRLSAHGFVLRHFRPRERADNHGEHAEQPTESQRPQEERWPRVPHDLTPSIAEQVDALVYALPSYLPAVVLLGSPDTIRYDALADQLRAVVDAQPGATLSLIGDDEATQLHARADYHDDDVELTLFLPHGTAYEAPVEIPVEVRFFNTTDRTLTLPSDHDTPLQLEVRDHRQERTMLTLTGKAVDGGQSFELPPQRALSTRYTVSVDDLAGTFAFIGMTVAFEFEVGQTWFQTAPLHVTVK